MSHPEVAQRLPGFADILGLWPGWLPIPGLPVNLVDNPFPFPLQTMGERHEARVVWMWVLKQQEPTLSDTKKQVLKFYEDWLKFEPGRFRTYYRVEVNSGRESNMMQFFQERFYEAYEFLIKMLAVCTKNLFKLTSR
jgi:hypothetical protein